MFRPNLLLIVGSMLVRSNVALADTIAPLCALRDLRATTTIEMRGEAQDVPARGIYGAAVAQQLARSACRAGHTDEALALYDLIMTLEPPITANRAQN
jgi:pentatricopeptide repeat protein